MMKAGRSFESWSLSTAYLKLSRCMSTKAASSQQLSVDLETGVVSRNKEAIFQTVIGMEIHAQLDIPTKLFSPAPRLFSRTPNNPEQVYPFDVAVPGFLPVLSKEAVHAAVLTAAACRCHIEPVSRFERKHYFYADLPLGYQMTQQRWPLARNGTLVCRKRYVHGKTKKRKKIHNDEDLITVGINRIQMEQDTGKTTVVSRLQSDGTTSTQSLIDFNRAGCALLEIVFEPDIRSANDAAAVVTTLRDLLKHIGTCDGRMDEGSLRCDLNVSVAPLKPIPGSQQEEGTDDVSMDNDNPFQASLPPGTGNRVEVKNLNSMRQVVQAAVFEAKRQAAARLEGKPTAQETRTFNVKTGQTVLIRSKEGAVDYRFTPEPDLPPLVLTHKDVLDGLSVEDFVAQKMPELPEAAVERLKNEYGLPDDVALVITSDVSAIAFFEEAVQVVEQDTLSLGTPSSSSSSSSSSDSNDRRRIAKLVSNWLCNDLFGLVKEKGAAGTDAENHGEDEFSMEQSVVSARQLGELVVLIEDGTLSSALGKKILAVMYTEDIGKSPRDISNERGWKVISDMDVLREICRRVVTDGSYGSELEHYRMGDEKLMQKITKFFFGKAMSASDRNAQPELLQEALEEVLGEIAHGLEE